MYELLLVMLVHLTLKSVCELIQTWIMIKFLGIMNKLAGLAMQAL